MTDLPAGWVRTTLGEIAETRLGKMLSAKAKVGTSPRPYLRNKNVQWGRIDVSDMAEMDFNDDEVERFTVSPGDVLVCEGGEVGRTAVWRGQLPWVGYQKALHRIRPARGVSSEYLAYLMRWFASSLAFEPYVTGSTIKHLPQEDLRLLPVPIPPEREQRRIVAAIEEQFSRLDAADDLLRRSRRRLGILRDRAIATAFLDTWEWTTLGEIAEIVGGVTKDAKRQADPAFVEVPYLRVANVQRGFLDLTDVATIRVPRDKATALELRPGDVLFNEGGDRDKLGRGWIWSGEIERCIHQNHVFRARLDERFEPKSVSWHGNTFGQRWFDEHGRQTTNLASLNLTTLKSFPVPAPPIDEQRRVVAEVELQLSLGVAMEAEIDRAMRRSVTLRRSLLERAFAGKLVPQDPADEPAIALLEGIAAARLHEPKVSRRRRKVPA